MKQTTKMSRAINQLEHMYNALNQDKFNGELPVPVITVQSKPGTWGHCTKAKIWQRKDEQTYEMNIAAEQLSAPLEEIIDTIVHEMIHLYCREHNIKETSRNGKYHNGKFKELAEKAGLVCYKEGQYGWNTIGTGNDALVEYALAKGWNEIILSRNTVNIGSFSPLLTGLTITTEETQGGKRPSSTRKLQCPNCGNSVRATKKVRIMCMDCMQQMNEV